MSFLMKTWILQIQKFTNFIVLVGENKEFYWYALIQTIFVLIGKSANKIFAMYLDYRDEEDFVGMDMCRKFLEMGFTRSRRYANHRDGKKYDKEGNVIPQEPDHATCHFAKSAKIFKKVRDIVAKNDTYVKMRKHWRKEVEHSQEARVNALATASNVKRAQYSNSKVSRVA